MGRAHWRALAQEAVACVADLARPTGELRRLGQMREMACPSRDRSVILAFAALKACALAYDAEPAKAHRAAQAPALAIYAALVGDILDATAPPETARTRPFRADIDG